MIRATLYIPKYDWLIHAYIAVHEYYTYEILDKMRQIGADRLCLSEAHRNLTDCKLNGGLTFSNPQLRETVWVTEITSSASEFFNTIVHEIGHVAQHISKQLHIDPYGEEVCYMQGDIAMMMFPFVRSLLCDHCRPRTNK